MPPAPHGRPTVRHATPWPGEAVGGPRKLRRPGVGPEPSGAAVGAGQGSVSGSGLYIWGSNRGGSGGSVY